MGTMRSQLEAIEKYCSDHTAKPPDLLEELERITHLQTLAPQMMTSHLQGRLISLISRLVSPRSILEIGTFTGYGALCLAEGLQADGVLHTIEADPAYHHIAADFVQRSPYHDAIVLHQGDACQVIPKLESEFDLVYIDAAKREYQAYYDLVLPRLSNGGLILADNMLWSGKVLEDQLDEDARALKNFAEYVAADNRIDQLLLPIRDGLFICQRIT